MYTHIARLAIFKTGACRPKKTNRHTKTDLYI